MDRRDFEKFADELESVLELKGKPAPSASVLKLWFRLLGRYSLLHCLAALDEHTANSPFVPTPDGLIKSIVARDGRPTAEEAWATALAAADENYTIIWTDEIAQALSAGAGDLLADGDKTAARMAFRDSYTRLVLLARENGVPVKVWVSQGHDRAARYAAIEQAAAKGLLSHERAAQLMIDDNAPKNEGFLALVGKTISEKDRLKRMDNFEQLKALLV